MEQQAGRNVDMAQRIHQAEPRYPFTFVVAGDSGAWPDPTADAIFSELVRQVSELDPAPSFFANLGDFAGPGTRDRHEHYLGLIEPLPVPDICVLGNHELDAEEGLRSFSRLHGPANFEFAYGNTCFVVLRSVPGTVGQIDIPSEGPLAGLGPRQEDLDFLAGTLERAGEPNRVILMHMPPSLGGHFAPHPEWGFSQYEDEFLDLLRLYRVDLVCCAHGLAFDTVMHEGTRFVMSGGGGSGLCSHFRGICTEGAGRPEDRGAVFHAVEIRITEAGKISGRLIQAFARPDAGSAYRF